ncbi:PREDICTED: dystonin isoform X30 [Cercocebus atys]|uniref:dystonin isoform X30 n=1 Tax=Cercocebus atys TaxID=9531 RepID=UPI0005F3A4AF|nr:PREDICTED: dystonin isoform X30 [Cercocebus atys]
MIAAAFLVLLRPYSIQCALFLLLLLLGTIATIVFFCCWHRKLQKGRHPMKSVFSGRSRSRDAVLRSHHFRSEVIYLARTLKGFRASPRHIRRRVAAAAAARLEEVKPVVEVHQQSEQETSVRKRRIKKSSRVQPEFYHSVQGASIRRPSSGNASYRCSMSSSADFSDEDDFSQKSGSASPAPGDTLPWNLPKHERSKRKIQGGSVLDPAERAVLRIADERDKVQKKTFTKWINQHLMKVRKHVNDLYEDLRDGHNLISLLEVLSGDTLPRERDFLKTLRLVSATEACEYEQHEDVEDEDKGPREKGRMRFHRLQNVQIALDYLKRRQVKLVNIRNDDITDGNPKLTLGLIWTIILHFQISDIHVTGESEDMSAKERLLLWTQQATEGYAGIRCENFTTCWRDGKLFNAIIHKYRPDLIDMNTVAVQSNLANLEHAFYVAEKIGVIRLLDPEDVDVSSPDEKSVITYVSSLYDAFPKVPEGGEGIGANDVEVKWIEYQNMVNYLIQWIRHHVTTMSERTFPNNPVELKALYNQYLQFKETEIPPKETEKSKIKRLYKLLEIWIEFGRIKLLQGYHPNDIEKEWGKLIIAMLEREKALRPEVERLEMLQQIAHRVQRDSVICEDKLILARNALQSDSKRLESGVQFQNEAEIAGYILECENLLRQHVIDVQILIDGKYYQADQLVQRVAKLRDEIMALRNECSSVYSKGRMLTTEQTKLMISGITQSLNSGFAQTLHPSLTSGLTQSLTPSLTSSSMTSGLSSGMTSRLTPSVTPAYTPGFPSGSVPNFSSGVEPNSLQTLKLMQIRKPLLKSSLLDQNLTEEEINMKFVQDLLNWVEEMQVQLDRTEWGSDLPSVESHLENHKNVHRAIEEFESSLKEAKISEIQMTAPLKLTYAEKLHRLESQYAKLLNTSRNQERHLDTLHNFVSRATNELIWLNEKEEEEVAYDWSERNTNVARKKDYHAELMRELDQKEENIKSVQEIAEQLLLENHPARLTIEAYRAAMQTQWSWILQLCQCVEQHVKENTAYFEFFNDAKEATDYLRNLKDAIQRKYSCDRSSSIHKLEDLVQESMEEKEELLQYKSTIASLMGKAKTIIQLKPRNSDCPLKTSIPIKAICDYRQIEITIYKDDECVLANNSHRAKWKVISPTGNEAMVPSVCFTVPPPNKEAVDFANRIEQQYQNVLTLWHESHINMKSVVSWHYLINEIDRIRASNVASIKTMLPGEHQQVLSNLQSRFEDFLEDSQESQIFSGSDITQLEKEVNVCKQYYQELLKSAEREEQEESVYNLYISEVRNIRLRLENCEDRLIRQIRTPLERDDLHESVFRITEQEKLKKELERLKDDLGTITNKCEEFFSQAAASSSVPTLRSELNVVLQNMNQVYSMSSTYIDKLKTVNLVLKNTQAAEALVKLYETKLCEEEAVIADKNNIENLISTLKQWRSEVDEKRQVFHALEDELQKAKAISDEMFKTYKERDLDFDWHKEKADQLVERWQNVHVQIDNRLRDLEGIGKSLKYYRDTYHPLDDWIQQVETTQRKIQENQPENSKTLATQLNQQKMLVSEIEMKQSKMDECQKYAEQYSATVKDYELQTMTYRAMVDSQQKSPVKRRRMQSSADLIIQEFMDLRTRYTALVTLMTQYIKFAGDSLKRLEEEEIKRCKETSEHGAYSDLLQRQKATVLENSKLTGKISELERMVAELKKQKSRVEEELPKVREAAENELRKQQRNVEDISLQKIRAESEAKQYRRELETIVREKEAAERELERVRQLTIEAEAKRAAVEENLLNFRNQLEENTFTRRTLEDHLKRKDLSLNDLEQQKNKLTEELRRKRDNEEELLKLIKQLEKDFAFQKQVAEKQLKEKQRIELEARRKITEIQYTCRENALPVCAITQATSCRAVTGLQQEHDKQKAEELKQQVDELTAANRKAEQDMRELTYELNALQLEKTSSEEKARLLKDKLDETNNTLRCLKLELERKDQAEKGYSQQLRELGRQLNQTTGKAEEAMQEANDLKKIKHNYQLELESLHHEKGKLQREVDRITRAHAVAEKGIQHLNSQIHSFRDEKELERLRICQRKSDHLKEQFEKSHEQLLKNIKAEKENNGKIQRLNEELEKSNECAEMLKQKVEELTRQNNETKLMMRRIQAESENIVLEKQTIQQRCEALKIQADGFKDQLRSTNEHLHKQTKTEQDFQRKIKCLEEDLAKSQNLVSEFKQKCDQQNIIIQNTEKEVRNLNAELNASKEEKRRGEQKVQLQQAQVQELNNRLKKVQDELHLKTIEEQMTHRKMVLFQEESDKFKQSAEEFRKKMEKLMESKVITENDISGIKLDFVSLQQENCRAQENAKLCETNIKELERQLQQYREQMQQGQHVEANHYQKCRKLEDELIAQKCEVENLKQKMDQQIKEHEHQLVLLQCEIKKKNTAKDCTFKPDFEMTVKECQYSGELSSRNTGHLHPTPRSPLLRWTQEPQPLEEKWQHRVVEQIPKEVQFQPPGAPLEKEKSQQCYSEYFSQTSTELQITFDETNPITRLSEIEKIRDQALNNSRPPVRYQDNACEMELVKLLTPLEKSLEEEKKEHVEKAKELQKWVSNISKTLKDAEKAGKPPFSMQKISSEEISTKKEQLSETLQAMQLFLAKHGDKMTDEERNELEKQVKSLQESYNLLFSESLKQLQESQTSGDVKVEEKLDKVIAGTIDQTTGEVLSVFQAVLRGLIDYDTGIRLLETQLMISGLISPELRKSFELKDAKSHGLIDEQILCQLKELNKAKEIISAASPTTIPVLDALAQSMISESMAIKVLEILLSTGSLVIPATGEQLTLQKAFQQNLVSSALFSKVLERQNMCKDLIDPCTSEKVSLIDMVQRSTLQENTGMWLLPVRPQEGGRITLKCGRNLSILRAAHEGLIDCETMFRLLSAQLLSGGLINSNSGQRMTVEEAVREGVIDRDTASSILTYQVQTGGIIQSNPAKRLTVDEAVQCDLITSSSALLVLEAQRGYVGLIWPHSGEIFPTSSSLQQELITNELAYKILNSRQKIAALYIPESSQVIGLDAAKQLGIIDNNTASILKNIILPDKMPDLGDLEACKNARRWLSFCKFQPSTVHDYRQEDDVFDGEEPVTTQTSEQTKKLFLSYLMINSYMDANTGQRLLLYDGDLDEAVGMLLEGCHAEFDGDTAIKECLDVLSSSGVFLNNASGREKDECTTAPSSFNKCHCGEPEHEETPENRKCAVDEEFHEMGNNVINSEFSQSEKLANTISIDPKVNSSPSVCVPSPISYLTQTELADISMLRNDSENILTNYENQSQVETNEHASECSHSKNIQNFPGDLIENPIVKSKMNKFCGVNETENEDNTSRDSPIFDYSPRLSALLSHDKLRHRQGSFNDTHTPESNGNKCEAQTLSFSDKTMLSGQRIGEKFQDQFLGIAAINISLPGEQCGQKSLNMISSNPQVQCHNDKYISDTSGEDEKTHPGFQQMPEDKKNESEIEEYSCAVTPGGYTDNAIVSLTSATPLLDETISAGDYETSLLNDQQNDTGTDTDSDDDFYDTPLFEDDDHDSLLLDGDDHDCLHPGDYDTLQEENDEMASPADVFYDVLKENENSMVPQGALAGSLSVKGKAQCRQDFLMDVEKDELDSGEKIHLNPVGSDKVNRQSLETGSERECTNILEGDESDSLTDYDIVGGKESFTASLKFDDNGSWRVRKEEYVTVQEFHSDTDHLDSMQSEESYGDYIYDSNDQDDDDNDGIDEEGGCIRDENGKHRCQDVAEDMNIQLCASIVNENSDENKNINKMILLDKMHSCSSLEKQQRVNVVQLASPSENSLATEESNLPEYTIEIVGKSKENLLNHEMVLKDLLLPIIKDTECEKTFGPASISHNNNISSTSELGNDLANTKVKLIQGSELPELTDSVKGKDQYFKNMAPKIDSSLDHIICTEPDLMGKPAEESHLSSIASVTDKDPQGNGSDLIKGRDGKSDILIEDETSIQKMYLGEGEVLVEGLVEEENRHLKLLPGENTRDSFKLINSQFPFSQITNNEELNQKGSLKKATVTLKDEPNNLQIIVSKSPVQFENLEEIFDTSVSKEMSDDITSDITSWEGNTHFEESFTDGPEKELDVFTYLKHCAKNIKAKDVAKPNEDVPSHVLITAPPMKEHLQLGVNNTKEKSTSTQKDSPVNEMIQSNDLCSKESISGGGTEISQFTPESIEATLSILSLKHVEDVGKNDFLQSDQCANGLGNDNSSNTLNTDYSFLEISNKKERIEQQLPKEQALSPRPQEKEVEIPELSQVFVEDVKDILKSRLKEGHMNPQEVEEPSACADTEILVQNLIKQITTSQLVNEASTVPSDSQMSDSSGVSPMSNSSELKAESRDDPFCLGNLKSELLLNILKQDQHSQKITGLFELMRELTHMEYDLEKRGITSKVLPLQLENIFYKLLADGYSEKIEHAGDFNQKACSTSEMMEEKPHILSDIKSKEVNHYSPNLETVKEIGLESSTVCASALPRDEKLKDLCDDFPSHLECISGSKEMASGDSSTEQFSSELQQCLQHTEKMHEYLTLLQDMKPPLDNQESLDNNLEALKNQLRQLETFELGLAPIAVILRKDMKLAEEFLKSLPSDFPRGHLEELSISHQSLKTAFSSLSNVASERTKQIMLAIDSEMSKLAVSHKEFLQKLKSFSDWISEKSRSVKDIEIVNVQDSEYVKKCLEFLKNVLKDLGHTKMQLETTAFDVQFFISEYAQDLSPNQSKQLLRLLNTTQKCFLDVQESVTTQVERLETQLHLEQDLDDQKIVAERQQEYKEKLQGICDLLTQTENRLIGHQEAFMIGDGTVELKKYQSKQEELQKDMQGSAQALAEVVKNTENFLKENGEKLSREDKALIEQKLNEAKIKCEQLNLKAEQSKKELDKVVTTAIKEETEKVAAVKQLEESKTKIENLLDWLSNVDEDSERAGTKHRQVIEQNGTHFQEGDGKSAIGEEDEVNGNLLETDVDGQVGPTQENLNQQYQKVKAQHEKIISQHQAVIIATQSAQVLLEKQGQYLSPEEKEKLQKNMKELKAHYETALAESEKKMKLTHSLQEELEKFDADYTEFEHWLQQSEQELENLEAGADDLNGLMTKLKRQKSFSEDVISHKGDLRYITISGNRVLEAAKSCSKRDGGQVDTSATHREVQHKLDHATDRFRSLYSKCNVLGNNLKDLVDKYQHYEDASCGLLSGLQACEATASKHLSEPIAVDPKNLQRQLEETKALQGQISSQQVAVEKLKKTAEVLLDARGSLLPAKNDIQKTLDDIVGRYEDLSKSVNERNEKLQITLTRSLSVQDGLDEMLDWMGSVESSLKEQGQVPLNSAALQDIISKNIMLEQDIAGRQSSINAMNEKVEKFMETTDPSTASSLQAKMKDLSARFSEASHKHKETLAKMEELKTKVELFENLSEKLQTFLETKTQALTEVDVPGKDVTELSQYMQESTSEFLEHKKDLEVLHSLLKEISSHGLPSDKALVFEKTNNLSKKFKEMEDTIKEKKEAVTSCQEQLDAFQVLVKSLKSWIKETTKKVPIVQPSFGAEDLGKSLEDTKKLQEKWSLKTPEIQKVNNSGISLCNLISAVTTPAKAIAAVKSGGAILNGEGTATNTEEFWANKGLTSIKKDMTDISHDYEDLGLLLKDKIAELNTKLSKLQKAQEESSAMMQWLQKMNKTATKWHQTPAPTDTEAVKTQVEQNKSFEAELKQNVNKVQELKDKLTELLEENPDTPEAPRWKQMLTEIDSKWQELNQLTIDRQQKLEESSNNLTQFQTVEAQLKQWLVEKELMVSVLGPLSIDPNMLNTQRQQVQILLQEFATRKPQYEQLTAAGQGILSRPGEDPSLRGIVKEQLAAVTQKWDSLTGQLSDRCDWIDQAIVKSTQYQSLLRSLSDKLSDLDNKLSSSLAVSTHPDAMNQQLETAQKMKQEIQQEKKQIKVAQALCEDLSALVKEEYLKAELSRQLEGILKSFKDIEQKAESHVQHLQSACASSHQFQQMSRDFQAWLDTKKEEQNKSHPISAKLNVLESLIKDHKDFSKTLTAQSHIYEKTIAEGENLLLKTQGSEKAALQLQLNTIKTSWDTFNKQVKERENKLKDSLEKALKYKEQVETLRPWIDKCQNNLEEIKFCLDPAEGENSIAKLKSLQKEMDQHFGMVELLNNTANSLLSVCEIDKEVVTDENKSLIQKVDMVTEQLHNKKFSLENMAQKFKEFQEVSKESKRQLHCAKEQLDIHDSLGPQAYSNKYLTMLQTQQKSLQALKHQVDLAKRLAQDLVVEASDSKGTSDVLLQAETIAQEHSALSQQVDEKCSFLETKLQGIGHFQNTIREMFSQFAEFDDELDSMAPVGRDAETLQKQKETIKAFLKKLEALIASNDNANKTCKMMLATEETSPDLVGIKRDLEALSKQCNKLLDRAQAREEQVEGTIKRLEEFYSKLKEFSTLLQKAEEHEESQGPVGMETETINQQLEVFKRKQNV